MGLQKGLQYLVAMTNTSGCLNKGQEAIFRTLQMYSRKEEKYIVIFETRVYGISEFIRFVE